MKASLRIKVIGRRENMRKKNIARAGAAFVLLLGLTGTTIFYQGTEAASGAENSKKVATATHTVSNDLIEDSKSNQKNMNKTIENSEKEITKADSKAKSEKQDKGKKAKDDSDKKKVDKKSTVKASVSDDKSENLENTSDATSKPSKPTEPEKPSGGNSNSQKPSHTHSWETQTTVKYHPATGHNEQVLVKDAWTETIPIYETVAIEVCNTCGADITSNPREHIKQHMLAGEGGSAHTEYVQKQTGTETVTHPAEYTTKWIEDSPAWSEEVVTGYICSCGATK